MNTNDYPALNGRTVTEGHARICRESGHATHRIDGHDSGVCPRCGEVTTDYSVTDAIVTALGEAGIPCGYWHTGGGCMALGIGLNGVDDHSPDYVLVTDGDASLPTGQYGILVGRYDQDTREEGEMLLDVESTDWTPADVVRVVLPVWEETAGTRS